MTEKEKEAIKRCRYACDLLASSNIKYQVKKESIGHINLFYKDKCIMSFWARTGKFIFNVCPPEPIITIDDRGIKNCIDAYWQLVNQMKELEKLYES